MAVAPFKPISCTLGKNLDQGRLLASCGREVAFSTLNGDGETSLLRPPSLDILRLRARYSSNPGSYDPWEDPDLDLPLDKILKKGDPGTFQAVIKGVMPVGYWVTMPSGKEAYLPAQDIGLLGGLQRLQKIFRRGDEVTVRVVTRGSSGREVVSLKVPDPNKPDPPPKPLREDFLPGDNSADRRRKLNQQR
ncbi:hypothetical protein KP509_07G087000 [Ceratopteris richardii]|uniref:S1 motif domain-containing protein n=1 Tax=Ceratopteris richardii TaxID=49495 RepID=A0A8T2UIZ7_CERRI|nr:hypothetical protein KP509_07G087000 [Ceratopteris richardii]